MQFHMMKLLEVLGKIRFSIPGLNLIYSYPVCKKLLSLVGPLAIKPFKICTICIATKLVMHIKVRLLILAVVFFSCFHFQNGGRE